MAFADRRRAAGGVGVAQVQVTRLAALSADIADAMRVSFNGEAPADVAARVQAGELAIARGEGAECAAYAIVSTRDDVVTIEAVEGRGGMLLTRELVQAARAFGYRCEAWVLSESRARLSARAGLMPTGARRFSASGREQLQVSTK